MSFSQQQAIERTTDGYFQMRTVLYVARHLHMWLCILYQRANGTCVCMHNRILGLGNAADAIEILSIGYILAVYEDKEGSLTRTQQSTLPVSRSLYLRFITIVVV